MKINKNKKVELVASNDATRPQLHNAWFDAEKELIISTNGRAMAVVKVQKEDGDVTGYISPESLKAARKTKGEDTFINANESLRLPLHGIEMKRPSVQEIGNFPNWDMVIPKERKETVISFNVTLLNDLSKSLGTEEVVLHMETSEEGGIKDQAVILITGDGDDFGLIMPNRIK